MSDADEWMHRYAVRTEELLKARVEIGSLKEALAAAANDQFIKSQMERADKANAALCIALEMLAHIYSEWEQGTPCYEVTESEIHTDAPLGNALRLGDEEDAIIKMLDAFFPSENLRSIDPKTWEDRIEALAPNDDPPYQPNHDDTDPDYR